MPKRKEYQAYSQAINRITHLFSKLSFYIELHAYACSKWPLNSLEVWYEDTPARLIWNWLVAFNSPFQMLHIHQTLSRAWDRGGTPRDFVTDEASPIRNDIHVRLQSEGVTYAQRNMHDTIPRNVKMAHLRHVIDTFRTTIQEKMSERTW